MKPFRVQTTEEDKPVAGLEQDILEGRFKIKS